MINLIFNYDGLTIDKYEYIINIWNMALIF